MFKEIVRHRHAHAERNIKDTDMLIYQPTSLLKKKCGIFLLDDANLEGLLGGFAYM
jgi:hypothetical protein